MPDTATVDAQTGVPEEKVEADPKTAKAEEVGGATDKAEATTEGDSEQDERKPKSGYQKQREKRERAEADRDYWREQALRNQPKPEAEKPAADPEPKLEDFEEKPLPEYLKAVREWDKRQLKRELAEETANAQKAERDKSEKAARAETFAKQADELRAEHDDFDDLCFSKTLAITAAMAEAIETSDVGAKVLYELGSNPEEARRIAGLPAARQAAEIGKLEARIAGESPKAEEEEKPPAPPVSRAPKPPTPVKKVSAADDGELRDDLAPDEWKKRYDKKMEAHKARKRL